MIDCDFIPADYHLARTLRRSVRLRSTMVATLFAMMVIWSVAHHHEVASAQAMLAEVGDQEVQLDAHKARRLAMEQERERLAQHRTLIQRLEERSRLVVVLSDISRRLPKAVVLTEINVESASFGRFTRRALEQKPADGKTFPVRDEKDAKAGGDSPAPSDHPMIRLRGIASSAPEVLNFAASLEDSPLLRRVQLLSQEGGEWAARRAERFEIVCDLQEQEGMAR